MKLTKAQLKRIIKEELSKVLNEQGVAPFGANSPEPDVPDDAQAGYHAAQQQVGKATLALAAKAPNIIARIMKDERELRALEDWSAPHTQEKGNKYFEDITGLIGSELMAYPREYGGVLKQWDAAIKGARREGVEAWNLMGIIARNLQHHMRQGD